jgi:Flp pilus assembly protein TadG
MSRRATVLRLADDSGAISIILVLLAGALFGLAGLVWDGGRAITARQHAADLAEQAARAGANDLDLTAIRDQGSDSIDGRRAIADACHYVLVASPASGCTATATGESVTVTVTTHTPTALLGIIGLSSLTTHGHATASAVRGVITGEDQP